MWWMVIEEGLWPQFDKSLNDNFHFLIQFLHLVLFSNLICQPRPSFSSVTHITWGKKINKIYRSCGYSAFKSRSSFAKTSGRITGRPNTCHREAAGWCLPAAEGPCRTPYPLISLGTNINFIPGVVSYTDYICQPWISIHHSQPFMNTHPWIILWQLSVTDKSDTREEISKDLW